MTATFYVGDAVTVMNTLPEKSVDLILTSPPFLALRSYLPQDHPDKALEGGSQATPGAYIDWLLDVVEACARVLAPHGSLCFELGDTYSGSGGAGGDYEETGLRGGQAHFDGSASGNRRAARKGYGGAADRLDGTVNKNTSAWPLAKSLSLIPESFRWSMVYGHNPFTGRKTEPWRLRNVIRWVRPNPPVGALGDKFRPATSELMVFCKSKDRFFDLDAVREPASPNTHARSSVDRFDLPSQKREGNWSTLAQNDYANPAGAPPLDWWNIPPGGYPGAHYAVWPPELLIKPIKAMCPEKVCRRCGEASRRIVATQPEQERQKALGLEIGNQRRQRGIKRAEMAAWFRTYKNDESVKAQVSNWELAKNVPSPDDWEILKQRLGVSASFDDLVYGQRQWTESEITYEHISNYPSGNTQDATGRVYQRLPARKDRIAPDRYSDCLHDDYRPGLVLDPFAGSGTTLAVATGHGRNAIGIDLDERNYELALDRVGPLVLSRAA